MKRKPEHRYIPARELRVNRGEHGNRVTGYAAVFNSPSEDLGGFREIIAPGAFTGSLVGQPDVRALINHDPNLVLGRTKAGTLDVSEDNIGLGFNVLLPATSYASDLAVSMERGDVDQCSFGFFCLDDVWQMDNSGNILRTVKAAEVFDVSVVTYPAYTATSASLRSLWREGRPESIDAAIRSLEAPKTCTCDPCKENNCVGCSLPTSATLGCECRARLIAHARLRLAESSLY